MCNSHYSHATTSSVQEPTRSGSSIAVQAVLRGHERVAALPSVARTIRRFVEPCLLVRLKHELLALVSASRIEHILSQRSEELRLEALEAGHELSQSQPNGPPQRLPNTTGNIINDVFMYGAQHESLHLVHYGINTLVTVRIYGVLRAAVENGHMEIVQFLHPRVSGFDPGVNESSLLDTAAAHGQPEALEWIYAN